jgi:hypothetical protein
VETRFYIEQYGGDDDVWIGKTLYRFSFSFYLLDLKVSISYLSDLKVCISNGVYNKIGIGMEHS